MLAAHGLPTRWAGREHFVVLELGFGLGHGFLACWQAWRQDPARCGRLFFVSVEPQPPSLETLAQAHAALAPHDPLHEPLQALLQAWPPLTPNLHRLCFEEGRVQLLLALGEVADVLPALPLQADAFCLMGGSPSMQAAQAEKRVLKALAARAAPGATLGAWCLPADGQAQLASTGFVIDQTAPVAPARTGIGEGSNPTEDPVPLLAQARWAPRATQATTPRRYRSAAPASRQAVVVGAGLAGAAAAQALVQAGWQVTVLERHAVPAQEASGNPAGLFHGTVNADDGPYARLFRAAALQATATYAQDIAQGVPGAAQGLLRLDARSGGLPALQELWQRSGLPASYVQVLGAEAASALAGLALPAPAWFYPGGGWMDPAAWVRHTLQQPGLTLKTGAEVASLARQDGVWALLDATGAVQAQAHTVVLANAASAQRLLAGLGHPPWPLRHTRGQVTQLEGPHPLRLPVAGDGYAIPLPGGVLCGATREAGEPGVPTLRLEDHHHNLQRLQRLTGLNGRHELHEPAGAAAEADGPVPTWPGRTGWRLHSDDRLPIAGAVPLAQMPAHQRLDQPRLLPREEGLFVLTALGARGLTLAPLLAQLVAAQATGTPWPLEQDLADAVDPGRWQVRAARHASPTNR
jgi:tRNA 5-methylaminomethyl-2-thiouridine biosynthesis bifunctional protein